MIKIGLPLDSNPELTVGDLAVGRNFVCRPVIVVIFIGLGRGYRLWEGVDILTL